MTALAAPRDVARYGDTSMPELIRGLQKGATTLYQGALAVFSGGYLAPGSTALNLVAVGIALRTTVNAGADGANGNIEVRRGIFPFKSAGAGDQLAQADVGKDVYIVDDQLVGLTSASGTRSKAGRLMLVDGTDFYVAVGVGMGDIGGIAAVVASLTGTLTGTANGSMVDIAATASAVAGGASPTAAQVDTGIALAVSTIVSGTNEQLKELQTTLNAVIVALKAANLMASA